MSRLIDSLPTPSSKPQIKILVVGTARTGSTSLALALQKLNYNTANDLGHNYFNENLFPYWTEAVNAKYNGIGEPYSAKDFHKFIGAYDAITGWHCALMAEELITAFPEAKIILTERDDEEEWVDSYDDSVARTYRFWNSRRWVFWIPFTSGREYDFHVFKNVGFEAACIGKNDKEGWKRWYLEHNEKVKKIVGKERLLVMKPGDGWGLLCEFLGKGSA